MSNLNAVADATLLDSRKDVALPDRGHHKSTAGAISYVARLERTSRTGHV